MGSGSWSPWTAWSMCWGAIGAPLAILPNFTVHGMAQHRHAELAGGSCRRRRRAAGATELFALADSLAGAAGGAVLIQDRLLGRWRIPADSNTPTQRGWRPCRATSTGAVARIVRRSRRLRTMAASDEPLFVAPDPDHGMTGRMVVAVRWAGHDHRTHGRRHRLTGPTVETRQNAAASLFGAGRPGQAIPTTMGTVRRTVDGWTALTVGFQSDN